MRKRSCKKTALERTQHDTAVKVRKMTDEQLCAFLDELSRVEQEDNLRRFLDRLSELKGTGNGISTGIISRLRKIAVAEGLLMEELE